MNINVGIKYIESWLNGNGCVPLYDLMEDAATAEISRAQLWQWIKHGCMLDTGKKISSSYFIMIFELIINWQYSSPWISKDVLNTLVF